MIAENSASAPVLVWFRKDLRLHDNPALQSALLTNRQIVPVFVWDSKEGGQWSPGAASRWWLHQALKSLSQDIEKLGGKLILAKGEAADLIPQIARDHGASKVLYGRTYDPPGLATQEKVEEALDKAGIDTESFNSSLLQEPWETKRDRQTIPGFHTLLEKIATYHLSRTGQLRAGKPFFLHIAYPKTKP